ncbi:MmgE/PrpD family protein [Fimbriimonas ginsengisoli]|uniref:MmgE/PrpD family domain containing protein n=1 Tax=Fimbriimonas ginsengisoli Gsoil 348 TaxID=661478 RepID=A0A068NN90_FIMGI|nr:MmgE/PrpD family protein [Fimbriimonas ginsengisoli]AIE85018.1 MmgE/PrpD family domain containing protein [Fimbriimonas ginsengisoli Gsoil 348]
MSNQVTLARNTNQALGIGQFAIDFLAGSFGPGPSEAVLERNQLFHTDAVLCGVSALALRTNAPTLLRTEALEYPDPHGAAVIGGTAKVKAEKAIVANSSAVREWDSNGTNFGYNPGLGHTAGEFGHNDFYPVVIAACQQRGLDGATALRAMVLLDEIRGRLAEVFSLKTYKIDHVVHGAIASAAVYAALLGGSAEQIESAIGMFVAHYIPWRAIRAGKQLSDSKGASAAISTEAAVLCAKRALAGFVGPKDIFRNPESMFRQFVKTSGDSPFDLVLSHSGDDFAVMGMHFKLGLYEHQSAGALQGCIDLLAANPELAEPGRIARVLIRAYEPAFGIIGDPAKRDPHTRQSADHSMVYIVATLLRKATEANDSIKAAGSDELWQTLMLSPYDYGQEAIQNPATRAIMARIEFEHGGPEYDARYPDGIPTSVVITTDDGRTLDSGLVMYPGGHARNTTADLKAILGKKFAMHGSLGVPDGGDVHALIERLGSLGTMSADQIAAIYDFEVASRPGYE